MRTTTLIAATLLAACTSPPEPSEPAAPADHGTAPVERDAGVPGPEPDDEPPAAADASAGDGTRVLLRGEGDVDGDGESEALTLFGDGRLVAGEIEGEAELTGAGAYFMEEQADLRVAVLDRDAGTRVVILALPTEEMEDPPNRYQVFAAEEGELRRVFNQRIGVYGVTELRAPGDGTLRYTEAPWTACERAGYPEEPEDLQEVSFGMGEGGELEEIAREPTGRTHDCNELSACPFVYVIQGDEPVLAGEILRNLRGAESYSLQPLALPARAASDSALEVRLSEEKREVTYLDELYVEVGGERAVPRACTDDSPPAYCTGDRRFYRLEPGQTLDVVFERPASGPAVLYARGFYVPISGAPRTERRR